jgi:hypothetical protein
VAFGSNLYLKHSFNVMNIGLDKRRAVCVRSSATSARLGSEERTRICSKVLKDTTRRSIFGSRFDEEENRNVQSKYVSRPSFRLLAETISYVPQYLQENSEIPYYR